VDKSRYLQCLEDDYRRLRAVAQDAPAAPVPSCPEWTMAELVVHVAQVYVDKTETILKGEEQPWPPDLPDEDPITALDATYTRLVAELTARPVTETSASWYGPDQTVGFWVRRMAQETVIHRVDGELAAGAELAAIPEDLALDGIDEVLVRFLSYGTYEYPRMFGDTLTRCDGRAVRLDAGNASWFVRLTPQGLPVSAAPTDTAARVSGTPTEVLLWLWRRADDESVRLDGDLELVATLRQLLGPATQ
jgi:uncharacterized protein (TIGR03083 family)